MNENVPAKAVHTPYAAYASLATINGSSPGVAVDFRSQGGNPPGIRLQTFVIDPRAAKRLRDDLTHVLRVIAANDDES